MIYLPCLAMAATASAGGMAAGDFAINFDPAKVTATDATVAPAELGAEPALRVATGHRQPWPGIALPAPGGHWDLSPFGQVALEVKNAGAAPVTVHCRVDNPGADGVNHCLTGSVTLSPGQTGTLRVPLTRAADDTLGGKLFGMRGYPVAAGLKGTIDPANVTQLLVFVAKPEADHLFEVAGIRATGAYTPPTAWVTDADPFFPFIDTFGQYLHKDWPGKTHSLSDLAARRAQEAKELAAQPGPKDWDRYGGSLAGPQLNATGFFRTEKVGGKWWLVDPDGHLFFSHGIDCVRPLDATAVEERENWFADFPGNQPEFAQFLSHGRALMGHYQGRSPQTFSFACANLLRKYGTDWLAANARIAHQRLRSWGLNTIANWSDERTFLMRLTPYTDSTGSRGTKMIEGSEGYWSKFPDVFDASFAAVLRRDMEGKRGKSAGDAWCIGYFSDNEMSWGDEVSLAVAALKSPPEQPAKKAFIADLQAKYGDIAKLNEAWGTAHASWDALLESRDAPDLRKANEDLAAFYSKAAEQYFRTVRDAVKAVAPNQLYLGCRFAWVNDRAAAAAAKYCDVVSYNLYRRSVADFQFNGGADVPLIIGEFHFGALDRGMFHTGLVPVADQTARAKAYKDYVLGALAHPQFVGCHWFQYQDEPVTGRVFDEENYQIGFVDVCDTPYRETIEASRAVGAALYRKP
ncbi:MAG: beta-galactosidase [Candidatus Brocadiia bacterium]